MPGRQPKSYNEILRGQQPAGKASDWDWPERAAARERAKLPPEVRAQLDAQERATDAFVRTGRPHEPKLKPKLKKESTMKTLRKVILERSKNVQRQQASLANKIDQRGGPKSAAEADVVNRENARQEGQAGNKAAGARAKRQVGRTGKKYLFGRLRKAIDRTKRRADKHRETGTDGAAVHRAKNVEAELWDRKLSAKHENTNTAYPLTAGRVFMFEVEKPKANDPYQLTPEALRAARRARLAARAGRRGNDDLEARLQGYDSAEHRKRSGRDHDDARGIQQVALP